MPKFRPVDYMNTSPRSEQEQVANIRSQVDLRRTPLEAGGERVNISRPDYREGIAIPASQELTLQASPRAVSGHDPRPGSQLNSMAWRISRPRQEYFDTSPNSGADAARAALDSRAGRTLTGAEWAVAQARLLEFVTILRGWAQKIKNGESAFGNVEGLCLQER